MKKITLLLFAILVSTATFAQFIFPADPAVYTVPDDATTVPVLVNDMANTAAAPPDTYVTFWVTADWSITTGDAYSNEALLTVTTTAGTTATFGPAFGGVESSLPTTLTFFGALPADYDPSVDGFLELGLSRSFDSPADWTNITVTVNPFIEPPGCATTPTPADTAPNVVYSGPGTISFSWAAAVGAEPTSYEFLFGDTPGELASLGTTVLTAINVTDIDPGTWYWQIVANGIGGPATGCLEWSFTTEAAPPAPANDLCGGATPITPGVVFESNPIGGQTQWSATDSGELPLPSCSVYDPADVSGHGGDIWYSVVVPGDGNLTIETRGDPVGNEGDTGMQVYSGSCGALVAVDCNNDMDNRYSRVIIADLALANQTVYVRVFEYSGNDILSFQISAYSATLGIGDNKIEGFKLFPNPVSDLLNFSAQQTISDISIYSLLGQEVMRIQPNTIKSQVDISNLSTGIYVVKVQVGDKIGSYRIIKQ